MATEPDLLGTPEAGRAAVRGGALRIAGYGVGIALSVASAALLFRALGVEGSGDYIVVLSLVTLFGGITDAGLSTIALRELSAEQGADRALLLRNLLGLRIVFTLAGVALACGYAALAGWDRTLVLGTAIAGAGLLTANVQNALATGLLADLRLGWVTLVDVVRQAATAVCIATLALAGAALLPFYAAAAIGGVIALALTVWLVRDVPLRPALHRDVRRRLLRDALPFALAVAVGTVYFRLAILFVEALSTETETGYFSASFRIVEVLVAVPQLAIGAAFPIFARAAADDRERLRYGVGRTLDAVLLAATLTAVGLGVGAPFIIEVIAGPDFAPAADVLRLHSLAFAGAFTATVFGYALLSLRANRAVLITTAAALAAMVVAGPVLTSLYDARGAAGATVISEWVLAATGGLLLARTRAIEPLSFRVVPRLALAAAVGVGVPVALGLPSLPAALLAVTLCAGVALATGAVPDELLAELRAVRARRRA